MAREWRLRALSVRTRFGLLLAVPFAICAVLLTGFFASSRLAATGHQNAMSWREREIAVIEVRAAAEAYVVSVENHHQSRSHDRSRINAAAAKVAAAAARTLALSVGFDEAERAEDA